MRGLTQRQQQTLAFLREFIARCGYPPTLREIGDHMGIFSTNGVNDHLRALERKGFLRKQGMKSRAIQLVDTAPIAGAETFVCPEHGCVVVRVLDLHSVRREEIRARIDANLSLLPEEPQEPEVNGVDRWRQARERLSDGG